MLEPGSAGQSPSGQYGCRVSAPGSQGDGQVRTAEVVAALSLATDLATGVPVEHGLQSGLIATRLCEVLAVDPETRAQAYYSCLLYYIGCTATARTAAELSATMTR